MKHKIIAGLTRTNTSQHTLEVCHGLTAVEEILPVKKTYLNKGILTSITQQLIKHLQQHPHITTLLEIGCGLGEEARFLKQSLNGAGLAHIKVYATDSYTSENTIFSEAHSFVSKKPAEDFKGLGKDVLAVSIWSYLDEDTIWEMQNYNPLPDDLEDKPVEMEDPRNSYFVTKFMKENPQASILMVGSRLQFTGVIAIDYDQIERPYERCFFDESGTPITDKENYISTLNKKSEEYEFETDDLFGTTCTYFGPPTTDSLLGWPAKPPYVECVIFESSP